MLSIGSKTPAPLRKGRILGGFIPLRRTVATFWKYHSGELHKVECWFPFFFFIKLLTVVYVSRLKVNPKTDIRLDFSGGTRQASLRKTRDLSPTTKYRWRPNLKTTTMRMKPGGWSSAKVGNLRKMWRFNRIWGRCWQRKMRFQSLRKFFLTVCFFFSDANASRRRRRGEREARKPERWWEFEGEKAEHRRRWFRNERRGNFERMPRGRPSSVGLLFREQVENN